MSLQSKVVSIKVILPCLMRELEVVQIKSVRYFQGFGRKLNPRIEAN